MKRVYNLLLFIVICLTFGLSSCTHERLFTESRYNYLKKVPVQSQRLNDFNVAENKPEAVKEEVKTEAPQLAQNTTYEEKEIT